MKKIVKYFSEYFFIFLVLTMYSVYAYLDCQYERYRVRDFLFFVNMSWGGMHNDMGKNFIYNVLFYPLLITIGVLLLQGIVRIFFKFSKESQKKFHVYFLILFDFFFIEGIWMYNRKFDIYSFFFSKDETDFYNENFVEPSNNLIEIPFQKRNIIYISLESMEKSFSSKEVYGNSLIKELEQMEKGQIVFEKYVDCFDCTPTAPSVRALFTGLPSSYYAQFHLNKKKPFSKVYSLGKMLENNGYYLESIIGSSGLFTDFHEFLDNHGIKNHIDREVIQKKYSEEKKMGWGYSDKTVFKVLKNEILEIEKKEKPFFLLVQTMDTHADDKPQIEYENIFGYVYYDIINNTAKLVADFIKWFKKRPEYKNTTIVIAGDHLRASRYIMFPNERKIYNLFINSVVKPKNTNRTFTQIDMFPTVLEAMGVKIKGHRLGLGTSVFSDEPTLAERYSPEYLAKELAKRSKIYEALW